MKVRMIPPDDTPGLIVIQVDITSARQAYETADRHRLSGAYVVLGGLPVTSLPEEAIQHADSIILGPVEDNWPEFLAEYRLGIARRVYRSRARTPDVVVPVPQPSFANAAAPEGVISSHPRANHNS